MAKTSKKRNKKYTGRDAVDSRDVVRVHRVNAVVRSDLNQWIHDHKSLLRNIAIGVLVVIVIVGGFIAIAH